MSIKVLELFGGIGAPRAALEKLGIDFEVVDYVEIDKYAVKSYNALYDTDYEPQDISEWDKDVEVDMIFHGSPCQDFSIAGLQAGGHEDGGTRSSLMWETVRIVDKLKPRYVIWENVKNVLSKKHRPTFDNYMNQMGELGYRTYYQVINAKHYGVPQQRERVFAISFLGGHMMYQFPQKRELKVFLKDLLEDDVDEKFYLSEKMLAYFTDMQDRNGFVRGKRFNPIDKDVDTHAYTITTSSGNQVTDNFIKVKNNTKKGYLEARDGDGDGVDLSYPTSTTRRGRVQLGMSQTLTTDDNKAVVVKTMKEQYCNYLIENDKVVEHDVIDHSYTKNRMARDEVKIMGKNMMPTMTTRPDTMGVVVKDKRNVIVDAIYNNREPRIYDEYAPTLRAGRHGLDVVSDDGVIESNLRIRKLTPKECWRLMGFEDTQFDKAQQVNSNAQLYKQAGNSIVVNVLVELIKPLCDDWFVNEFLK